MNRRRWSNNTPPLECDPPEFRPASRKSARKLDKIADGDQKPLGLGADAAHAVLPTGRVRVSLSSDAMKVGIFTDFPSVAVQSGPALHTRFLHDGLRRAGHDVTLIGPDTGVPADGDEKLHLFNGTPYPSHPKVKVATPGPMSALLAPPELDVIHGQTNNHMIEWANWVRKMNRTAVINTNIIHLPTHSHFILSDRLHQIGLVRDLTRQFALDIEKDFVRMYNESDGLVVQSRYMVDYWRKLGVTTPMWVVGRPIDPTKFSAMPGPDPFPRHFAVGKRLVVVCRHDREKNLATLLRIFDEQIAPADPEVTLTVVGHGHDHENLVRQAAGGRYANRVHFPGEVVHAALVDWYAHADVFVYTSLSETFGNVVNEALWCGLPVVALDDRMGVAHQIANGVNGFLVPPDRTDTDAAFARHCLDLVESPSLRLELGANAATQARRTSSPERVIAAFEKIYGEAIAHCHAHVPTLLSEQSVFAQRAALARHVSTWARYNYLLLIMGRTAGKFGFGRTEHVSTVDSVTGPLPVAPERARTPQHAPAPAE